MYNNRNYQSPGKAVGTGLNNFDTEYFNAWGEDPSGYWLGDNGSWWNEDRSNGNSANLVMMLERERDT